MKVMGKALAGTAALAALGFGGAQIAGAAGSTAGTPTSSGTAASQASEAAVKAVGGGRADSVERSDEGGGAVYEVKVTNCGTTTEVSLDRSLKVLGQQADDDQGTAGDRETPDVPEAGDKPDGAQDLPEPGDQPDSDRTPAGPTG